MPERDFNKILDKYMTERTLLSEEYEQMSQFQREVIQLLKRAYKRIQAKQNTND